LCKFALFRYAISPLKQNYNLEPKFFLVYLTSKLCKVNSHAKFVLCSLQRTPPSVVVFRLPWNTFVFQ